MIRRASLLRLALGRSISVITPFFLLVSPTFFSLFFFFILSWLSVFDLFSFSRKAETDLELVIIGSDEVNLIIGANPRWAGIILHQSIIECYIEESFQILILPFNSRIIICSSLATLLPKRNSFSDSICVWLISKCTTYASSKLYYNNYILHITEHKIDLG